MLLLPALGFFAQIVVGGLRLCGLLRLAPQGLCLFRRSAGWARRSGGFILVDEGTIVLPFLGVTRHCGAAPPIHTCLGGGGVAPWCGDAVSSSS